jgi:ribosomal protein S20
LWDAADILKRKLMVAIAERARQVEAWKHVNKTIPSSVRTAWQEGVDAFHADPKNNPNPYLLSANSMCYAHLRDAH